MALRTKKPAVAATAWWRLPLPTDWTVDEGEVVGLTSRKRPGAHVGLTTSRGSVDKPFDACGDLANEHCKCWDRIAYAPLARPKVDVPDGFRCNDRRAR